MYDVSVDTSCNWLETREATPPRVDRFAYQ